MVFGTVAVLAAMLSAAVCVINQAFAGWDWLWMLPVVWLGGFLGLAVLLFLGVLVLCAFVDQDKVQEKDNRLYRGAVYMIADAAVTALQVHLKASGLEKVPTQGRVMLVCNHMNNADPVLIMHLLKRRQKLSFIAKREAGAMFVVGKLMHKMLCQRINRENDREALKTILRCIELIEQDETSIAVFPEGGIHGDGLLHPFRHGVFKIAQRTQVPVVVCTLRNTEGVFRNGVRLRPTHVEFRVVDVIRPEDYQGMTAVQIGKMAHRIMAEDLGPELVFSPEETP